MRNSNLLSIVILVITFAAGLYLFGRYRMAGVPPFLLTKLDQLMSDSTLMDSIGGFTDFEYRFNRDDFKEGDTLRFVIKIEGTRKVLFYKATHVRTIEENNEWLLLEENLNTE